MGVLRIGDDVGESTGACEGWCVGRELEDSDGLKLRGELVGIELGAEEG